MKVKEKDIEQVRAFYDKCNFYQRRYPCMTYEEGVRAALDWVLGTNDEEDEKSFEDDMMFY